MELHSALAECIETNGTADLEATLPSAPAFQMRQRNRQTNFANSDTRDFTRRQSLVMFYRTSASYTRKPNDTKCVVIFMISQTREWTAATPASRSRHSGCLALVWAPSQRAMVRAWLGPRRTPLRPLPFPAQARLQIGKNGATPPEDAKKRGRRCV